MNRDGDKKLILLHPTGNLEISVEISQSRGQLLNVRALPAVEPPQSCHEQEVRYLAQTQTLGTFLLSERLRAAEEEGVRG